MFRINHSHNPFDNAYDVGVSSFRNARIIRENRMKTKKVCKLNFWIFRCESITTLNELENWKMVIKHDNRHLGETTKWSDQKHFEYQK